MSEIQKDNTLEHTSNQEARAFSEAGWKQLNGTKQLAPQPANLPEGTRYTIAEPIHRASGRELYEIEGDKVPPNGMWVSRSVYEVKGGKWELINEEQAA